MVDVLIFMMGSSLKVGQDADFWPVAIHHLWVCLATEIYDSQIVSWNLSNSVACKSYVSILSRVLKGDPYCT